MWAFVLKGEQVVKAAYAQVTNPAPTSNERQPGARAALLMYRLSTYATLGKD